MASAVVNLLRCAEGGLYSRIYGDSDEIVMSCGNGEVIREKASWTWFRNFRVGHVDAGTRREKKEEM